MPTDAKLRSLPEFDLDTLIISLNFCLLPVLISPTERLHEISKL